MISNQILQSTIDGLRGIARVDICVFDTEGKVMATTTEMPIVSKAAIEFTKSPADSQEIQGHQFFKVYDEQQLEYVLVVSGVGESVYTIGKMIAFQLQNMMLLLIGLKTKLICLSLRF